ncbi:cyclic lactone autoinducer peptide [Clostridium sp. YIM B02505]|uniref:Cyclic lactone autoinducer peptide n=1 Tax=Clostridium yunnanense TaxID=2800325 RepID=A0ABS1EWH8_9CLOT|nr:cyclic lactone autoinducer peptide [Clostridium yunnanense]MBK1813744.1 cyclic lactone autoinducer peptide [Clostridium yunnanense]
MKKLNFKKGLALTICALSMVLAETASSMCLFLLAKEPKMPESLYKRD